jgi:hypothetical protein
MSRVANEIEFSHISYLNSGRSLSPEKNYLISCVVSLFTYGRVLCLLRIEVLHYFDIYMLIQKAALGLCKIVIDLKSS